MSGRSQPKLFKLVCKQAVAIREPYRNPAWPKYDASQIDKKILTGTKTKQTFQSSTIIKKKNCSKSIILIKNVCMLKEYISPYVKHQINYFSQFLLCRLSYCRTKSTNSAT